MTTEELTDAIAEAINGSLDLDWNPTDGAKAIIRNVPIVAAIPDLIFALYQYRGDLRRPPSEDSKERRHAMINKLLAKVGAA